RTFSSYCCAPPRRLPPFPTRRSSDLADQKLDESRLQLKLAGAELRSASRKLSSREVRRAARAKADEAMEAARHASEIARLNAAEAAKATRLAAAGTVDRAAELLRLEKLRTALEA